MLGKKIRKISTAGKLRKLNMKRASPLHGNGQQEICNSLFNISTVQACNNFVTANRRTDGTASKGGLETRTQVVMACQEERNWNNRK